MTQPNIKEATKQKFHWPLWFPYPTSWLKALILALFLRVIIFVVTSTGKLGYHIAYSVNSPELFLMFTILLILSPIPIISFTHHCLHLFISRFLSETQAPEIGKTEGLLPGIISWWEGLYAWLVIVISILVATFVCILIFPVFNVSYNKLFEYYPELQNNILVIFSLAYIFTGALIYQIEYLVKCRIISAYSGSKAAKSSKSDTDLKAEQEINILHKEIDAKKIKLNVLSNEEETKNANNQRKYRDLFRKWRLSFLILLITIGIYLSSKVVKIVPISSEIQTEIPSKTALATPSPLTSESPTVLLETDTFREAVNKAINAANLTQSAKFPDEWKIIVSEWQAAIALMKNVPSSNPNYAIAQQKIIEYQKNLNYAEKRLLVINK